MRGCYRLLGLSVAMVFGVMTAGRADAGFSEPAGPGPISASVDASAPLHDFTPRCDVPDLKLTGSSTADRSATALDIPDAWDFRTGQKSDDHLVARLTGDKPQDRASYSLFWEDPSHTTSQRGLAEYGVEVRSANPVVVPLPPGVWAGLAVLTGIAVHEIRRHRRQVA